MLRTCVVGMGHIGHRHARAYTESDKAELVAVCDRVPELAKAAGEKFGVPYFTNAAEMFAALNPDLCSVTTGGQFLSVSESFNFVISPLLKYDVAPVL